MIAELGQVALILALLLALIQSFSALYGVQTNNQTLIAMTRPAAYTQCIMVLTAFGLLAWLFISQDFSVEYVARNSNSALPIPYRISAVWGAHEGSLLLWVAILNLWTVAVAVGSKKLPQYFAIRVLGVLAFISIGFLMFTLFTSNPFDRLIPAALEGNDLNPLLQDPGLIIHPPMLYFGYVGFSVAFAFAIAALLSGKLDREWVRWTRPWTHVAWAFLTLGIALGSWWAYYELGWGGWWFWDPVENASFMPWLVGTALIHAQAVTEKRGAFQAWTLLLAISAFSLSLLGTFLVRSGVLTSVHAFASDPTRGLFILVFLGVVTGGSLLLYAVRAPKTVSGGGFGPWSKESLILINNLMLTVAATMVLLGTLYPLAIDALGKGKISVGPPYFGTLFILLMAPLIILLPAGAFTRWKKDRSKRVLMLLLVPFVIAVTAGLVTYLVIPQAGLRGISGMAGGVWVITSSAAYAFRRTGPKSGSGLLRSELAMTMAHIGVGIFVIGVSMTSTISSEKHLAMSVGDTFEAAGYVFTFEGTKPVSGPNWNADQGHFVVSRDGEVVTGLYPQKRRYVGGGNFMTEAAIDPGLTRDLYVSLGEPLDATGNRWAVRIYHKPFVRWIWLGALFMTFGGVLAATDRRYRTAKKTEAAQNAPLEATA
jgi:cytochrome c-type biogenesis protein CcmF